MVEARLSMLRVCRADRLKRLFTQLRRARVLVFSGRVNRGGGGGGTMYR